MMAAMRAVRAAALAAAVVVAAAAPAGASTTVLANQKYPWFYWAAPILTITAVLLILAVWAGYTTKVLFPKYRGRKVKE